MRTGLMNVASFLAVAVVGAVLAGIVLSLAGCGDTAIPPAPAPPAAAECAYTLSESDGSTVIVAGSGGTACTGLQSGLAHYASPWGLFTGTLGGSPAYCTLDGNGGTLTVYQVAWQPSDPSIAAAICASEEANGWTTG